MISSDAGVIRLFGLSNGDSHNPESVRALVRDWLRTCAPTDFTILVGHSPDFVPAIQDLPIDLCLAGHTHGGQIRMPFVGPLITLTHAIPREWARGFRAVGCTRLNVSAGIGAEHAAGLPSIRLGCPPEFTVIRIEPIASSP